jgi:hypothetical protein
MTQTRSKSLIAKTKRAAIGLWGSPMKHEITISVSATRQDDASPKQAMPLHQKSSARTQSELPQTLGGVPCTRPDNEKASLEDDASLFLVRRTQVFVTDAQKPPNN